MFEELGRGDAAYAFALSMHNAVAAAIGRFGSAGVKRRWGRKLTSGKALGGFSLTEPHAGSDAAAIKARLKPDGDGFRLTGTKGWVSLCGEADVFLVVCRTGTRRGTKDVAMVVLDASRAGVETARLFDTMTSAFLPIGEMQLRNVRIEADEVLAPPGSGFQAALGAIDVARTDIAAIAVGLAAQALARPSPTREIAPSSAGRCSTCRASSSRWPTWRRTSSPAGCSTSGPPRCSAHRRAPSPRPTPSGSTPTWRCRRPSSAPRRSARTAG